MRRREFIAGLAGAGAWPLSAHAQHPALPILGLLSTRSRQESAELIGALISGVRERGLEEGRDFRITYRWAEGRIERVDALAQELAREPIAVAVAAGGANSAVALKRATASIPVVFVIGGDPVALGLVSSLARPGGTVTGTTMISADFAPKRLELLREIVPRAAKLAIIINPNSPEGRMQETDALRAAKQLGLSLDVLNATDERGLEAVFARAKETGVDALLLGSDPIFNMYRENIVALAAALGRPVIYQFSEYVHAGGLISYGASISDAYRQAGQYAARIITGDKPADLPVVQPSKFDVVINLKTAKALGIAISPSLLARADEVIE